MVVFDGGGSERRSLILGVAGVAVAAVAALVTVWLVVAHRPSTRTVTEGTAEQAIDRFVSALNDGDDDLSARACAGTRSSAMVGAEQTRRLARSLHRVGAVQESGPSIAGAVWVAGAQLVGRSTTDGSRYSTVIVAAKHGTRWCIRSMPGEFTAGAQ